MKSPEDLAEDVLKKIGPGGAAACAIVGWIGITVWFIITNLRQCKRK